MRTKRLACTIQQRLDRLLGSTQPPGDLANRALIQVFPFQNDTFFIQQRIEHVHGLVEATKLAIRIRNANVTDPTYMGADPDDFVNDANLDARVRSISMRKALAWPDAAVPGPTGGRTRFLERPRAGKTGTTNESRDVWFCGFTADYTCVVWIGYRDNRPLGRGRDYTGGRLAAPIWTQFMIAAHEGLPKRDFEVPEGVSFSLTCQFSVTSPGEAAPEAPAQG